MRAPSLNLRINERTFHSTSVGGRFEGLLKNISYSIFSRRSCCSRRFSSSSVVTNIPQTNSLASEAGNDEVPAGHTRDGTKVPQEERSGLIIHRLVPRGFRDWRRTLKMQYRSTRGLVDS